MQDDVALGGAVWEARLAGVATEGAAPAVDGGWVIFLTAQMRVKHRVRR